MVFEHRRERRLGGRTGRSGTGIGANSGGGRGARSASSSESLGGVGAWSKCELGTIDCWKISSSTGEAGGAGFRAPGGAGTGWGLPWFTRPSSPSCAPEKI